MARSTRGRGEIAAPHARRVAADSDAQCTERAAPGDRARAEARELRRLQRRRDALVVELGRVERELARRADPPPVRGDGLSELLHRLLTDRTLGVAAAADAARRSGYRSRSKDFRSRVNQVLSGRADLFRRVAHGRYTARRRR